MQQQERRRRQWQRRQASAALLALVVSLLALVAVAATTVVGSAGSSGASGGSPPSSFRGASSADANYNKPGGPAGAAGPAAAAAAGARAAGSAGAAAGAASEPSTDMPLAFGAPGSSSSTRRQPWVDRAAAASSRPAGQRGRGRVLSPAAAPSSASLPAWARGGGRILNSVGGGLLIPLFVLLKEAKASPFDPHPLPLLLGLCFFNGWYVRVTDHERQLSFALIVGSFKHPGANTYTEHYVGLVYSDRQGNLLTAHAFPDPDSVTIDMDSEGYAGVPSNFTWRSQEIGELHIDHNKGHFDFALPGFAAEATFHDRVPWNRAKPDVDGPEGWLGHTPLLPCRYFVYSLASRTSYRLRIRNRTGGSSSGAGGGGGAASANPVSGPPTAPAFATGAAADPKVAMAGSSGNSGSSGGSGAGGGGGMGMFGVGGGRTEVLSGRGFAHLESNYGNHFPRGWIWVNCISPHRDVKLVMVGGKFEIGPAAPTTWVIGYRSPRFQWNLRTTDLDVIKADVDYSTRSLYLVARSRCGKHRLQVNVTAPESSFGSPIYVPTPTGFSCLPGCRESFTARARIQAIDSSTAPAIVLTEEHDVELAALEFGGDLQRL